MMAISETGNSLFLFAHQDDEFGVFQKIVDELASGKKVYCAYLTDGVPIGHSSERRNQESILALTKLGVVRENILFMGDILEIPDGKLIDNLKKAKDWLMSWISCAGYVSNIYLPAWEGGHPDHDSLHAIGVIAASESNLLDIVFQYPLYNSYKCIGPFFRVLHPLPRNGEVIYKKMSWVNRFRFLRLILCYPSQKVTWIGLLPFVLIHYLLSGTQSLQKVSLIRIVERPHIGKLYYERRYFYTWSEMVEKLRTFV